jgi:hypothetical protein
LNVLSFDVGQDEHNSFQGDPYGLVFLVCHAIHLKVFQKFVELRLIVDEQHGGIFMHATIDTAAPSTLCGCCKFITSTATTTTYGSAYVCAEWLDAYKDRVNS